MARHTIVYKDDAGEWRWTLIAGNGAVLADSGEGYVNRQDCIEIAREIAPVEVEGEEPEPAAEES